MSPEVEHIENKFTRREFLHLAKLAGLTALAAACQRPNTPPSSAREVPNTAGTTATNHTETTPKIEFGPNWTTYDSPSGFTIGHPAEWRHFNFSQPPRIREGFQLLDPQTGYKSAYHDRIGTLGVSRLLQTEVKPGTYFLARDDYVKYNSPWYKSEYLSQVQTNLKEERIKIDGNDATFFSLHIEHQMLNPARLTGDVYRATVNFIRSGFHWQIDITHNADSQIAQKVIQSFKIRS